MSDTEVRWSQWCWVDFTGEQAVAPDLDDLTFDPAAYKTALGGAVERLAQMPHDELAHEGKRFLWPWQWCWKLP